VRRSAPRTGQRSEPVAFATSIPICCQGCRDLASLKVLHIESVANFIGQCSADTNARSEAMNPSPL
jgi:hypothetical protein